MVPVPKNIHPIIIYSHNADVDAINHKELGRLIVENGDESSHSYECKTYIKADSDVTLDSLYKACLAPQKLTLAVGARVMLLANVDVAVGLVNGSLGVVEGFLKDVPVVKFTGVDAFPLEKYVWKIEDGDETLASITQYPLKLAYASTIHKVQGMSLDCAYMDLGNIFCHAMAYVALSRVRRLDSLYLKTINFNKVTASEHVHDFQKHIANTSSTH